MSSVMDRIKAKQAAQQQTAATQTAAAAPVPDQAAPPPDTGAPPGLDINDREVADFSQGNPLLPFDRAFKIKAVLTSLIHVQGRNGPFYKADFVIVESDDPLIKSEQSWSKLFQYLPYPRTDKERSRNKFCGVELRSLVAACEGVDPKAEGFDGNAKLGAYVKESMSGGGLEKPFALEQYAYQAKDKSMKTGSKYSVFEI